LDAEKAEKMIKINIPNLQRWRRYPVEFTQTFELLFSFLQISLLFVLFH